MRWRIPDGPFHIHTESCPGPGQRPAGRVGLRARLDISPDVRFQADISVWAVSFHALSRHFISCNHCKYRTVRHGMTRINNASIRNQERKHPRFPLEYPVQLKFRDDGERQELKAMSNNISQGGVLLQTPSPVPPNCEVEFVMTIQRSKTHKPIRLKGAGRVVRLEQHLSGRRFGIAIACKRPIYWILRQVRPFLV